MRQESIMFPCKNAYSPIFWCTLSNHMLLFEWHVTHKQLLSRYQASTLKWNVIILIKCSIHSCGLGVRRVETKKKGKYFHSWCFSAAPMIIMDGREIIFSWNTIPTSHLIMTVPAQTCSIIRTGMTGNKIILYTFVLCYGIKFWSGSMT